MCSRHRGASLLGAAFPTPQMLGHPAAASPGTGPCTLHSLPRKPQWRPWFLGLGLGPSRKPWALLRGGPGRGPGCDGRGRRWQQTAGSLRVGQGLAAPASSLRGGAAAQGCQRGSAMFPVRAGGVCGGGRTLACVDDASGGLKPEGLQVGTTEQESGQWKASCISNATASSASDRQRETNRHRPLRDGSGHGKRRWPRQAGSQVRRPPLRGAWPPPHGTARPPATGPC